MWSLESSANTRRRNLMFDAASHFIDDFERDAADEAVVIVTDDIRVPSALAAQQSCGDFRQRRHAERFM